MSSKNREIPSFLSSLLPVPVLPLLLLFPLESSLKHDLPGTLVDAVPVFEPLGVDHPRDEPPAHPAADVQVCLEGEEDEALESGTDDLSRSLAAVRHVNGLMG